MFWRERGINRVTYSVTAKPPRRARQAKTDRIDLERLTRAFLAYLRGEPRACGVVRVPIRSNKVPTKPEWII